MAKNTIYLYGRNSVIERIKAHPDSVRTVYMREGLSLPDIEKAIKHMNIAGERLPAVSLEKMRPQKDLQGVVAKVELFQYTPPEDLINDALNGERTLLFVDRVNDPLGLVANADGIVGGRHPAREEGKVLDPHVGLFLDDDVLLPKEVFAIGTDHVNHGGGVDQRFVARLDPHATMLVG